MTYHGMLEVYLLKCVKLITTFSKNKLKYVLGRETRVSIA